MNKRKTVKEGRNTGGMREGRRGEKTEDTRSKKKNKFKKNMSVTQYHAVAILFPLAAYILGISELF